MREEVEEEEVKRRGGAGDGGSVGGGRVEGKRSLFCSLVGLFCVYIRSLLTLVPVCSGGGGGNTHTSTNTSGKLSDLLTLLRQDLGVVVLMLKSRLKYSIYTPQTVHIDLYIVHTHVHTYIHINKCIHTTNILTNI